MQSKVEIIIFSHVLGKVETVVCDKYRIKSNISSTWVVALDKDDNITNLIPWNRVKQININK